MGSLHLLLRLPKPSDLPTNLSPFFSPKTNWRHLTPLASQRSILLNTELSCRKQVIGPLIVVLRAEKIPAKLLSKHFGARWQKLALTLRPTRRLRKLLKTVRRLSKMHKKLQRRPRQLKIRPKKSSKRPRPTPKRLKRKPRLNKKRSKRRTWTKR